MVDDAVYPKCCIDKVCSYCVTESDEMGQAGTMMRDIRPKARSKPF